MTTGQPLTGTSITPPRRLAWFIITCAGASLAFTLARYFTGASVRWTVWTLPLLLAANAAVLLLRALNRWPRLVRVFVVLSLALAGAVFVSEAVGLLHR